MFWDLLDEILNTVLFALIGLEMLVVSFTPLHFVMGLAAIAAMLAGRFISVGLPVSIMRLRYRFERGTIALLTWGGLRGGISIALALSLPPDHGRDLILSMTYITVVFSILVQGTSFGRVARAIARQ
jgi:CPA1 family monovalent cation:H+ antiporter